MRKRVARALGGGHGDGPREPRRATPQINRDLGRLLFALLVLWAYLDFMQILIIWNSDLPEEAAWYLMRLKGEWLTVAVLIAACHFLLPFFALIWPQVQRSRAAMGAVAALLVLIEAVRAWWIVIPAAGRGLAWVDLAAMAAVLGVAASHCFAGIPSREPSHRGLPSMPEAERVIPDARHEPTDIGPGIHLGRGGAVPGYAPRVRAPGALALSHRPGSIARFRCRFRSIPSRGFSPIPQEDLQSFYAKEMQILNGTGWVDKDRGVVHIPITQAMQEVAREGIAGWPAAPEAPP